MTTRTRLTWALRWLVSVALLAWILTRPELGQLGSEVPHMNVLWLLGGLLCAGLSLALGAWRWQACLRALGMDIALPRLFKVTLTATAAGCISFGALGADLTKVVLAGRHLPGRQGGILSSLAMDHVSALPCVVVMVLAATLAHGTVPMLNMTGVWLALGVAALVAVAMAALGWKFKALHHGMMRMLADRATWRGLLRAVWRSVPMWIPRGRLGWSCRWRDLPG